MNETNNKVGERFVKLAKGARDAGLWFLGVGMYVSILVLIVLVILKGFKSGKLCLAEAVAFATYGTAVVHWVLYAFSA